MKTTATILIAALALGACAGRPPAPVAVVQPADRSLDCTQIAAEVTANDAKLVGLGRESGNKTAQNVAAGVVGLFFLPAFALMDFQDAAGKDTVALQQRQSYLASLAVEKRCGA